MVQRFQRGEVMLQGWVLKMASVPATIARKASGDLAWDCRSSRLLFCIDKPSADSLPEDIEKYLLNIFPFGTI